jgi:hypothetical protein
MPTWFVEMGLFVLMVVGIAGAVLISYGVWLWSTGRLAVDWGRLGSGALPKLEVPVLVLIVSAATLVMAQQANLTMVDKYVMVPAGGGLPSGKNLLWVLWALLHTLPVVGGLLALRWVGQRGAGLLLALLLVFGGIGGIVLSYIGISSELMASSPTWGESGKIAIPMMAALALRTSLAAVALVAALLGYAMLPRGWCFVASGLFGGLLASFLSRANLGSSGHADLMVRFEDGHQWIVASALANLLLVGGVWLLPRQRQVTLAAAGLIGEGGDASRRLVLR